MGGGIRIVSSSHWKQDHDVNAHLLIFQRQIGGAGRTNTVPFEGFSSLDGVGESLGRDGKEVKAARGEVQYVGMRGRFFDLFRAYCTVPAVPFYVLQLSCTL